MKVKVHYLFSKNKKIGSKFIAWGTEHLTSEPITPSHIAILINGRWVFESTLTSGVRVIPYAQWKTINIEVEKIPCIQIYREYAEIKSIFNGIKGRKYDWLGILYFGGCIFANKYFKRGIPFNNKWENPDKYFCSEAVGRLITSTKYSMKAPVQLLNEFRG